MTRRAVTGLRRKDGALARANWSKETVCCCLRLPGLGKKDFMHL